MGLPPAALLPALVAVALALVLLPTSGSSGAPRPNIILALIDDWGHSDVGYTNRLVDNLLRTPRLDELSAADGSVQLHNYYVQHICTPTRSVLLSGRYQIHTGLQHATIHPAQPSSLPVDIPLISDELQRLNCESQCDDLQPSTRKFHLTQSDITCLYRRNALMRQVARGFLQGSGLSVEPWVRHNHGLSHRLRGLHNARHRWRVRLPRRRERSSFRCIFRSLMKNAELAPDSD